MCGVLFNFMHCRVEVCGHFLGGNLSHLKDASFDAVDTNALKFKGLIWGITTGRKIKTHCNHIWMLFLFSDFDL